MPGKSRPQEVAPPTSDKQEAVGPAAGAGMGGSGLAQYGNSAMNEGIASGMASGTFRGKLVNYAPEGRTWIIYSTGGENHGVKAGMPVALDMTFLGEREPMTLLGKVEDVYPYRCKIRVKAPPYPEDCGSNGTVLIGLDGAQPAGTYSAPAAKGDDGGGKRKPGKEEPAAPGSGKGQASGGKASAEADETEKSPDAGVDPAHETFKQLESEWESVDDENASQLLAYGRKFSKFAENRTLPKMRSPYAAELVAEHLREEEEFANQVGEIGKENLHEDNDKDWAVARRKLSGIMDGAAGVLRKRLATAKRAVDKFYRDAP